MVGVLPQRKKTSRAASESPSTPKAKSSKTHAGDSPSTSPNTPNVSLQAQNRAALLSAADLSPKVLKWSGTKERVVEIDGESETVLQPWEHEFRAMFFAPSAISGRNRKCARKQCPRNDADAKGQGIPASAPRIEIETRKTKGNGKSSNHKFGLVVV